MKAVLTSDGSMALCVCVCVQSLKLCLTLCDAIDSSMPSFPVLHSLPKFAKIHVR